MSSFRNRTTGVKNEERKQHLGTQYIKNRKKKNDDDDDLHTTLSEASFSS